MDLKTIEYFVQTYKTKNISKASSELFISQQGLSKAIRSLEMELGVPLFVRTKAGVSPTEYADIVMAYAQNLQVTYAQMKISVEELKDVHSGTIRLGLVNGALSAMPIGPAIYEFNQIYPDIIINPIIENDYLCENNLSEGKLDMAILVHPIDDKNIRHQQIFSAPSCICVNNEDPLAKKSVVTMQDLKGRPLITVDEGFKMSHVLKTVAAKYGIMLNEAFHAVQFDDFITFAEGKLGTAVLSELWMSNRELSSRVHVAKIADPDLTMRFCLAYNGERLRTPNEKLFYDFLHKSLLS